MEDLLPILAPGALSLGALLLLRGSLVGGCLAVLLSVCCFGYELLHFDVGPLPLTIDRIALGLVIAMYVWQRSLRRTDPKPVTRADWLTIGFVGWLLVRMLTSDWQTYHYPKGFDGPLWRYIGGYFTPLVLYWVAKQATWTERTARLVQTGFVVFGGYLAFTAVCEIAQVWSLVWPKYIADPKIGLHFGRARGPMVHGVTFGHYMSVCLLAGYVWACASGKWGRTAIIVALPAFALGVYLSYTRSAWIGAALGICTVLVCTLQGRTRNMVLGGMAMVGLLVGLTQMDKIVGFQREQSAADTAESASMRVGFAYVSWLMFQDRPLEGFGFGRFPVDKLPYLDDRSTDINLECLRAYVHHNTFLSILVDTGLIGLALFVAMLAYWMIEAWRTVRSAATPRWAKLQCVLLLGAVPVYAAQLLFHELSYTPMDNSLVFFLAGCSSALAPLASAAGMRRQATPQTSPVTNGLTPAGAV